MDSARLASLTRLYIAGELSADERDDLYQMLMSSPTEREQFDRRVAWYRLNHPGIHLPFATEFIETHVPRADITSMLRVVAEGPKEIPPTWTARARAAVSTTWKRYAAQWSGLRPTLRQGWAGLAAELGEIRSAWPTYTTLASLRAHSAAAARSFFHEVRQLPGLRYYAGAAALAVVGLTAIALVFTAASSPAPSFSVASDLSTGAVATLLHAPNVKWTGLTNEVFVGDKFPARELSFASGVIQLQFARGARLVVEGPARLQLISDNEAFLYSGEATAHVPTQATGFKLTAPALSVKDIGTEFGLRARSNAPAELHVFSGLVEMARPAGSAQKLVEGQAAQVKGRRVRSMAASPREFVFEPDVHALERDEQQNRFMNWRTASLALSRDRAALVHYTFQHDDESTGRAINIASNVSRLPNGIMHGQLGSGRWPDKRGLHFASRNHRLRFSVPNTLTSLTYMAWLKVDALNSVSNSLAITESGALGEVHWQIYRDGRVALSAHSGTGGRTVDDSWDRGISPPIFTPDRLGKWVHLTSVYEAESQAIKHYLNGELLSVTPVKRPINLKLGNVEVCNWGSRATDEQRASRPEFYNRHWTGCLDEFALLGRAMTATEVRALYQRGRVATGLVLASKE